MLQRPPTRTARIFGTEGTLNWDGIRHEACLHPADGGEPQVLHRCEDGAMDGSTVPSSDHFLDSIAKGLPPLVGGDAGQRTIYVIEAARRASREGRTVSL